MSQVEMERTRFLYLKMKDDMKLLRSALRDAMGRVDTDIPGYAEVLAKTNYVDKITDHTPHR